MAPSFECTHRCTKRNAPLHQTFITPPRSSTFQFDSEHWATVLLASHGTETIPPPPRATARCKLGATKDSQEAEEGLEPGHILYCHIPLHRVHVYTDDCAAEKLQYQYEEVRDPNWCAAGSGREVTARRGSGRREGIRNR